MYVCPWGSLSPICTLWPAVSHKVLSSGPFCLYSTSQVSNSSPWGPQYLLVFGMFLAPVAQLRHWLAKEWTHLGLRALMDSWLKGNHKNLQTPRPSGNSVRHPCSTCFPSVRSSAGRESRSVAMLMTHSCTWLLRAPLLPVAALTSALRRQKPGCRIISFNLTTAKPRDGIHHQVQHSRMTHLTTAGQIIPLSVTNVVWNLIPPCPLNFTSTTIYKTSIFTLKIFHQTPSHFNSVRCREACPCLCLLEARLPKWSLYWDPC